MTSNEDEDVVQLEQEATVADLLNLIGMPELLPHFINNGIEVEHLLNLQTFEIPVLLPQPKFSLAACLNFMQKYKQFMTTYDLAIHPSFNSFNKENEARSDTNNNGSPSHSKNVVQNDAQEMRSNSEPDEDPTDPTFIPPNQEPSTSESDSNDDDVSRRRRRTPLRPRHENTLPSTPASTNSSPGNLKVVANNSKVSNTPPVPSCSKEGRTPNIPDERAIAPSPLVNCSKIGEKRRMTKRADTEVDQLDLKELLSEHPLCKAILQFYDKNDISHHLSDDDRSTILTVLVPWLLSLTDFPTSSHYEILAEKIVKLFPSEEASIYFVHPKTEGPHQIYPKGKLPDRVKNCKTKLRKKGYLPPKKSKKSLEPNVIRQAVEYSDDQKTALEWLKRNFEPFQEVQMWWSVCAMPRLQELHANCSISPHQYIETWHGILKLPESYKLILDDFLKLPEVDPKYHCLRDTSHGLLTKWSDFSIKLVDILRNSDSGIVKKERKQLLSALEDAASENDKDYVLLQILCALCKQKGRIKMGKTSLKPTAKECKDAFISHVTVAAEFDNVNRERLQRHMKLEVPLQPYISVIGEAENVVRASYVIVNQVSWRTGSILKAVDLCLKTCFVLNCGYPPEARHLWMFIQRYFYGVEQLQGDHSIISTVTTLLKKLES